MLPESQPGTGLTFCCPACGAELQARPEAFLCGRCARSWPTREGIASFCGSDRHWGTDSSPETQAILEDIRKSGWDEAVHLHLPSRDRDGYRRIFNHRLADWFYLCDADRRETALELGAGLGGVSMRLAKLFSRVVAVESAWERVQFAAMLFQREGATNVIPIHADLGSLPLPSDSFDLVVIGDWFGSAAAWGEQRDPRAAQMDLLSTAARLLRPGGTVCLGVGNRWAPGQVLGRLRRSVGRRFGAEASEATTAGRHSAAGYRRLLEAAGFADVESYAAFPSHQHPRMLVPLADPCKLAWAAGLSLARRARKLSGPARLAHRLSSMRVVARLACPLSDSFVIWARRPATRAGGHRHARPTPAGARAPSSISEGSLARQLKARMMAEWDRFGLDGARPSSISVVQLSGNWERGGKVNWFVFPGHSERPALVAKIARSCTDAGRVKHEHEMLLWLRSLADAVSSHIPAPLALWEISGHFVSLQQAAAYPPVSAALRGDRADAAVLRALRLCVPFLTELALATRSDLPPGADHPYLGELSDQALLAAGNPLYPPLTCGLLRGLARLVQTGQQEHCAPFAVVHHGDMSAGDFLSDGGEFQVIDWEGGIRQGLPFVDLVHLGISVASAGGPSAVASTMRALVTPSQSDATSFGGAGELASAYCASLGLSDSERRPLAAAAVLNLMVRMPDSRLSELRLTLPSDEVPSIAAAKVLVEPVAQVP